MLYDATVYVIDEDSKTRELVRSVIEPLGPRVQDFTSAANFLETYDDEIPGCLLLDVRRSNPDPLEQLGDLIDDPVELPIIVMGSRIDVPTAVRAIKRGAFDVLEKPLEEKALIERIRGGLERDGQLRRERKRIRESVARLDRLSPREYEVLELVVAGKSNKTIAAEMGVSAKTVEAHRASVMEKMQAGSLAELVRVVLTSGVIPEKKIGYARRSRAGASLATKATRRRREGNVQRV